MVKIFVQCEMVGGSFHENIETTEIQYFEQEELSEKLAAEKVTKEQICMCFEAYRESNWKTLFD